MVEAKDVTVNVLISAVTTLVIIFLLIPLLKIPVPAVKEVETIETKKYYYPYVTPVALEGDYSDWTIYDSFDDLTIADSPTLFWQTFIYFNREETQLITVNDNALNRYTIATKTLETLFNPYAPTGGVCISQGRSANSAYGTYVVWENQASTTLYIIKNGVVVKTLSITDLGISDYIYNWGISPKGKYIVLCGKRTATGNKGWVVLVGS